MSTIIKKSCIEIDDEAVAGVTKAALLEEQMSHNSNNEAKEEQNMHQHVDKEDDIQPLPPLEVQIRDRIEDNNKVEEPMKDKDRIENVNQVEEPTKDKDPNNTFSTNVPEPI